MSVETLKNYLIDNPDEIIKILELTDFHSISFFEDKKEIRCAYYEGGNPTSVSINCNNLSAMVYSKDIKGDLINLICTHNNWSFLKTINFIKECLHIDNLEDIKLPYMFNGVYKHIYTKQETQETYPLEILNQFVAHPNIRFLNDNISLQTQFKFNIGFDSQSNRITVPWRNKQGELVGVTGRYNNDILGNNPKWKAIKNFPKGNYLYGLYENYNNIVASNYVIIGESEKFVMQLDSYGYNNALALGNCSITSQQARLIKSLPVNKIILALDEGISLEHMLIQCEKLQGGIFNNSKEIWCIYDNHNQVLKKNSKASPSDFGKENFEVLLNNYCFKKE